MQGRSKDLKHTPILSDFSTTKEAVEASGNDCNSECNTLEDRRTQATVQNETVEAPLDMASARRKFQIPLLMPTTNVTVFPIEGK